MTREQFASSESATSLDWSELISRARAGDSEALGSLCEMLRNDLLQVADRQLSTDIRSKLGASDIVQQSLLEAQRDLHTFAGRTEPEFRGWVKRILNNNLLDVTRLFRSTQRRDTSKETSFELTDDIDRIHQGQKTASSLIRRKETDEELLRAIAQLPDKNRRVVERRHRQGLSHAEIAKELGMSEVACRKLWSRTVELLRTILTVERDESQPSQPR